MGTKTKQTTFIIIDETDEETPDGGANTAIPGSDNGNTAVPNPYWDVPGSLADDNGNNNPYWDPTKNNPYWQVPSETQGMNNQTTLASNATGEPVFNGTDSNGASGDGGVLSSLRLYDQLRQDLPEDFVRPPEEDNTNVELFTMPSGQEIAFCHISFVLPLTQGDKIPWLIGHEDATVATLAIQDLNEGNGVIIPEVEGLNERCNVRFTTEWADTEYNPGVAIKHAVEQMNRPVPERTPCAFIGAYRSAVSMPMSIVTGLFGRPQISAASTSSDLDDKSQFPLFGRTIPSDAGNAIPFIIFMHNVFNINHLAVVNVNDAYGNAFVEGLRKAAEIHAPGLVFQQIPLDDGDASIKAAVEAVVQTKYRFIFLLVFTNEVHDAIMNEAYTRGVAGSGFHNWLYGDSFQGTLDGRTFPKNGPLHLAYRGSGLLEVSGGVKGMPLFDAFVNHFRELHNPADLGTLGSLIPESDYPEYDAYKYFTGDHPVFAKELTSGYAAFAYEAVIGLGLAACEASKGGTHMKFSGQEHYDAFKTVNYTGFAGPVIIDPETGTRDPASASYKMTNFVEQFETDPNTGEELVRFVPVTTHIFQQGMWNQTSDFIFNDGTSNLPADMPPPEQPAGDNTATLALAIVIPLVVLSILGVVIFLFYENKRKKNDAVWVVKKEEIKFDDPPKIIGRGTFGLVLLGEYRGTLVAVKRVIPPKSFGRDSNSATNLSNGMMSGMASGIRGSASGTGISSGINGDKGMSSWAAGMSMLGSSIGGGNKKQGKKSRQSGSGHWKQMKADFLQEMRYLSKLRHPCITTVMGAVTEGEPMLIMEYMDHGSLYDLLHNETIAIEAELILPLLRDITQGIRFLHSSDPQVIHGDLKAANILVDSRFRAKVADFGLSQKQNLGGTGTPFWMAPELLRGESANTAASDVYSFGILLYEVFSRRDPYDGEDADEVLRLVADPSVRKRPPAPLHMSDTIKALMRDCLEDDPSHRPICDELDTRLKRIDAESLDSDHQIKKSAQVSLFDIFPRHIAEALRDGRTVEAEHKDSVTIFFSDIVGFTTISSQLEPRKVANMLDRLYTKFDALSQQYDIFKVETIGDAYMAVTNLIKDQEEDHAKRIAQFAIDAIAAANETLVDPENPNSDHVNIRVGFHSGPVVADVVGTRNPRYCLFGDTVNTASRMESNSEANRIHCSRPAAKLLNSQFPELPLKSRGKVKIKGKGEMHTYWVNEGGRGRRHPSLIISSLTDAHPGAQLFSKRELQALAEQSSEFAPSSEFDVPSTPEMALDKSNKSHEPKAFE